MRAHVIDYAFWCIPIVTRSHVINYVLWAIPPVVMIAIAGYMLGSTLRREFPYFFNFVVFGIVSFAIEFPLRNWPDYYYVYWVLMALSIAFSFGVVVELVRKVVSETGTLPNWNIPLLCWCVLGAMAVIAMWPLTFNIDNLTNGLYLVDRTVRMAQIALAFLMVMFGAAVGISKRNLIFGIAVGFGLFALVNFAVMTLLSYRILLSKTTLTRVNGAAYVICTVIWLAYIVIAAKEDPASRIPNPA